MSGLSAAVGRAIAAKFPWRDYSSVIDVGCAEGAVPVAIVLAHEHLTGGGFDLAAGKPLFDAYAARSGVADRLSFIPGDFFTDPLPHADVLIVGHIFHHWNIRQQRTLYRYLVSVLRDSSAGSAWPLRSAEPDCWDAIADAAQTPIRELIPDLHEIAELSIPYARLPRRAHNAYAADFTRWSDIAGQTIDSLLSRPWIGERTARALLAAAKDTIAGYRAAQVADPVGATAAVRRLLDQLDTRNRSLLAARLWAARPEPQHALAARLGVSSAWVRRNQPRAQARLAELLADPVHHEVGEHANGLRGRLGPLAPQDAVAAELRRPDVDPSSETARVLLYIAGPYVRHGEWFENTTVAGHRQAAATVDAVLARSGAPTTASLAKALTALGMTTEAAAAYL
jgi:hypothetical protein